MQLLQQWWCSLSTELVWVRVVYVLGEKNRTCWMRGALGIEWLNSLDWLNSCSVNSVQLWDAEKDSVANWDGERVRACSVQILLGCFCTTELNLCKNVQRSRNSNAKTDFVQNDVCLLYQQCTWLLALLTYVFWVFFFFFSLGKSHLACKL